MTVFVSVDSQPEDVCREPAATKRLRCQELFCLQLVCDVAALTRTRFSCRVASDCMLRRR
jgi:hypothetical protein